MLDRAYAKERAQQIANEWASAMESGSVKDFVAIGDVQIKVISTPGHSKGSVCLVVEDVIFAGDTLFWGSCGRTDFPGGDYKAMLLSLARLARLEGSYTVYPGHDRATDLERERRMNPYMRQGLTLA